MEGRCAIPPAEEGRMSEHDIESWLPTADDFVTGNLNAKDAIDIKGPAFREITFLPLTDDGRINIDFDLKVGRRLSRLVGSTGRELPKTVPPQYSATAAAIPQLNILIQIVGSRGDVQPFVALGNELRQHGHRVRLYWRRPGRVNGCECHFRWTETGPKLIRTQYMVKNPGLILNMISLRQGDIQKKRKMISKMLDGCWRSCFEQDEESQRPFVADAIIANPPSFAHVHCAQALGVPLHLMFTMPWTSTETFPHPLANIKATNVDTKLASYLSYGMVQWLTWQGLGGVINKCRKTMDLEPIPATEGLFLLESLRVPYTYCWSPSLVPAPEDWPNYIDVCGFFFRETPKYSPPADLEAFLAAGNAPIFIGFGSIVIEHPDKLTTILLQAVQACGVGAIIQKGWSRLGGSSEPPKDVFYLDDCPHEWLFQRVSVAFHHGGAGTTACGLVNGRLTTIVPFFADQRFWGEMVAAAGAGPQPLPHMSLDSQELEQAILFCLTSKVQKAAESLGMKMRLDHSIRAAASSFHRNLPVQGMCCELLPRFSAVWLYRELERVVRLSKPAAEILTRHSKINPNKLRRYQSKPIVIESRHWDPFTGSVSAALGTASDMVSSTANIFVSPYEEYTHSDQKDGHISVNMLAASAKCIGRFHSSFFKGVIVDIPLAATEGLRALPRLYGEEVRYTGTVTDWRSGATVAGKTLAYGFYDGLTSLITQPYKGAKEERWAGLVKGIGKGTSGFVTKPTSAILGLVAYPGQGICKSLRKATHRGCEKAIAVALHAEGRYLVENRVPVETGDAAVLEAFDALQNPNREALPGAKYDDSVLTDMNKPQSRN